MSFTLSALHGMVNSPPTSDDLGRRAAIESFISYLFELGEKYSPWHATSWTVDAVVRVRILLIISVVAILRAGSQRRV